MTFSQTVSLQKQWKQFYGNPDCSTESLKIRKVHLILLLATQLHRLHKTFLLQDVVLKHGISFFISFVQKSNREHIAEAKQNKEYTIAMEKLLLPSLQSKTTGNVSVELKALHLAMLLTQFDHM